MPLIASDELDLAVSSRLSVTLTGADGESMAQAKFLSVSADPPGIWVQVVGGPAGTASDMTEQLAASTMPVTGCFVLEGSRYLFESPVLRRDRGHWVTESVYVDALLLALPAEVTSPEHRRNRRHRISDSVGGIHARLFRNGGGGAPAELKVSLWDLSAGGASCLCENAKVVAGVTAHEPLVLALNFRGRRILLLARRTHIKQFTGRSARMGLKFDFSRPFSASAQAALLRACDELDQQAAARR